MTKHGVPVVTSSTPTDPRQALQYGNHSSVQEHRPTVWETLREDIRRNRCLVFARKAAAKIVGLRVAPLRAVVTRKVRIINNYSFGPSTARGGKGDLNRDTVSEEKASMSVQRGPTSALKCVDRSANTVSQPPYPISQGRRHEGV